MKTTKTTLESVKKMIVNEPLIISEIETIRLKQLKEYILEDFYGDVKDTSILKLINSQISKNNNK